MASGQERKAELRRWTTEQRRERRWSLVAPAAKASMLRSALLKEQGIRADEELKEQLGTEGYQEMGRKGGFSASGMSGEDRADQEGVEIDESKFRTKT